jgi:hypothetical protein
VPTGPGSGGPPKAEIKRSEERRRDRDQRLAGDAARRERAQSKHAFDGLSATEALGVAKSEHKRTMAAPTWAPARLADDDQSLDFLNDHSARLDGGTGGVVYSTVPMRSDMATGHKRATDLTLGQRGAGFAPRNPLGPTAIPGSADGQTHVGDLTFDIPGAVDRPGTVVDGKVFYANTDTDTDTMIAPLPGGVETFFQLRSSASPEEVRMRFSLPAGATLEHAPADAPPGLAVIRDGETIATVTAPVASDAQGQEVPVAYELDGDQLAMRVVHRGAELAYPIMVDPQLLYQWQAGPRWDATGWGTYQSNGASRWCAFFGNWYQGNGLYVHNRVDPNIQCNHQWYTTPEIFEWNYYGEWFRSSRAYVWGFEEYTSFDPGWGGMCRYSGIYSVGVERWEAGGGQSCGAMGLTYIPTCQNPCAANVGTPPNYAVFGTRSVAAGYHDVFTNYLQAANVYVGDRERVTIDQGSPGIPSGWVRSATYSGRARQAGLGVASFNLTSSGATSGVVGQAPTNGCGADPANHCQGEYTIPSSTNNLNEGINTIVGHATDVMGNPQVDTTLGQVKVDRTEPEADATGELDDASDARVTTDSSTLAVHAEDENDAGTATSGVKSVEIKFDGADPNRTTNYFEQACASDSQPLDRTFQLNTAYLGNGTHTIDIVVTDCAGNVGTQGWEFTIDRTSPLPYCSDPSADPQGCQPDPPSTTPPSCSPSAPVAGAPGGTPLTGDQAASYAQQYSPTTLAASDTQLIEGLNVAPATSTTLPVTLTSYPSVGTLMPSTVGATAATQSVGAGTAAVCVAPTATTADALPPKIVNGTALVYANTGPWTDTIQRSTPLGVQEFRQIRASTAPETFSYRVSLRPGQFLAQLDGGSIAVIDPSVPTISGGEPAYNPPTPANWRVSSGGPQPGQRPAPVYGPEDVAEATPQDVDIAPGRTEQQYTSEGRLVREADDDADGQAVAIFTPPVAKDAAGTEVPAAMAITGTDTFSTTTSHRSASYSYPVMSSRKTTTTTQRRRKKNAWALAAQHPGDLFAKHPTTGDGPDRIRRAHRIRAVRVNIYAGACDGFASPGADLTALDPTHGGHETQCWDGADMVQKILDAGFTPYVSLAPQGTAIPPTARAWVKSTEKLWKTKPYNRVKNWSVVNEPDWRNEHFNDMSAAKAAGIWLRTKRRARTKVNGTALCPRCKIAAGEFTGYHSGNRTYIKNYIAQVKRGKPMYWAWHDYWDVVLPPSRQHPAFIEADGFLKLIKREFGKRRRFWLLEQGVWIYGNAIQGERQVQIGAGRRFKKLVHIDPNVDVVAYYKFFGDSSWDSALVNPREEANNPMSDFRPAYCRLANRPDSACPRPG